MIPVGIPGEVFLAFALVALGLMLAGQERLGRRADEARRVADWRRRHRESHR